MKLINEENINENDISIERIENNIDNNEREKKEKNNNNEKRKNENIKIILIILMY